MANQEEADEWEDTTLMQLLLQGIEDLAMEDSYQFAQVKGHLPTTWILLNNQSTVNIFYSRSLLRNVKQTNCCMRVHCNAGWTVTSMIG
jgi:hypothetical protein